MRIELDIITYTMGYLSAVGWLSTFTLTEMMVIKTSNTHDITSYVYSPGLFGSPVIIGRYCPYYVAVTGEEIHGTRGGNVLGDGNHITAVVFPEVNIDRSTNWFRRNIYTVVARKVFSSLFGIIVTENEASSKTFFNYLPEIGKANIAQEADINALRDSLKKHQEAYPGSKVVMYGDSRGAATTFNLIALDHPAISCAVLEGIFDSIPHLIKHCWRWKTKHPNIENTNNKCGRCGHAWARPMDIGLTRKRLLSEMATNKLGMGVRKISLFSRV